MLSLLVATAGSQPLQWIEFGLEPGIDLGIFTLRYYSLAYLGGILLGYWHLSKMIKAPGSPMAQRHADDLFFYCTLGIILGGRLGYAAFYTGGDTGKPSLFTHFTPGETVSWDLLRLWDGGMSFHGGVVGVLVAIAWVAWRGGLNWMRVCDYIAVNVPFGMFFGRLANFINGELWGRKTDVPWGMTFCDIEHTASSCVSSFVVRHPSQLYQAALEGLLMIVILLPLFWKTSARYRPGLLVGVFTTGIAMARFINEFFREPDSQLADFTVRTGLSMGQWLSLPMIAAGLAIVAYSLMRPRIGAPAADAPKAA